MAIDIKRNYGPLEQKKQPPQTERDRLMQEFLAKGGKIEKIQSKITKQMLEKGKF